MNRSPLSRRRPRLLRLPWLATAPPSPLPTASPIHQLLLDCLSRVTDPATGARLAQLPATDWRELVQVSARHGVGPLLYDRLTTGAFPLPVPVGVMQTLREAFLMNALRNTLLYQDLAQVLTALQQTGIRVAVLKGAHLAALIYPHIGLRPMADMDLLVPEADLPKADTLLRKIGYNTKSEPSFDVRSQVGKHLPEYLKPPHPRVEIHWTIAPPELFYKVNPVRLIERLRPVTIAGVETHVLSPEDFVLHQCIHLAVHRFCLHGLRPICDLAATLHHHREELDWLQIQSRAAEWRAGKCVYVALRLASELMSAEVSPAALATLRPESFAERWYTIAHEQVLLAGVESPPDDVELALSPAGALAEGVTGTRLVGKVRFILRIAFPPRDHMVAYMAQFHSLPLTGHRQYTCYLTRACDWGGHGFRLLCYGATHRQETAVRARQLQRQAQLWRWLTGPNFP